MMGSFGEAGGRLTAFFTFLCFERKVDREDENEYEKDGWKPV